MASNVTLQLASGATLQAIADTANDYAVVRFLDVDNAWIVGAGLSSAVKGNRTGPGSGEWGHCIRFMGARHSGARDLLCSNGWGDGVYVSNPDGDTSKPSRYVWLVRLRCYNNRRGGVSGVHWRGGGMIDCECDTTNGTSPEHGIDFEPNSSSQAVEDMHEVKSYAETPDVKGREVRREVGLMRLRGGQS